MPFAEHLGLYYEDEGSGPPVVLMHGLGLGLGLWDGQRELAQEFRVIRYDARGAGASPWTEGAPDDRATEDLLALLDHLGIVAAHLVAHSNAGRVAFEAALSHPERVASVVFVDSVLRGFPWSDELLAHVDAAATVARESGVRTAVDDVWLQGEVYRWVREHNPAAFQRVRELMSGWSGAEWLSDRRASPQEVPDLERLHEITVPVFVISGQEDAHDFVEIANMLTWWIPGAKQKSLLGVGHVPMLENPREFNLYLRGFLRSVAG